MRPAVLPKAAGGHDSSARAEIRTGEHGGKSDTAKKQKRHRRTSR